jgi:hypothetical protein
VRSRVEAGRVLAGALAAAGHRAEAVAVARAALREAEATQQISERAATAAVLDGVS